MSYSIRFHGGPRDGERAVVDVLPSEVLVDEADRTKGRYVSTGGAHSVNSDAMKYRYNFEAFAP